MSLSESLSSSIERRSSRRGHSSSLTSLLKVKEIGLNRHRGVFLGGDSPRSTSSSLPRRLRDHCKGRGSATVKKWWIKITVPWIRNVASLRIPNYFKQVKSYSTTTTSKLVNQMDLVKRNLTGLSSRTRELYTIGSNNNNRPNISKL